MNMREASDKIAMSQGITKEKELNLFFEAMNNEYWSPDFYHLEALPWYDSMMDFARNEQISHPNCRVGKLPEVDDFIVGKVVTNRACGDAVTRIISYEKLPREFDGEDVEIRLKKLSPPEPLKEELVTYMCESPMHELRTYGCCPRDIIYPIEDLNFPEMCGNFAGKKVKITIEELKE